MSCVKDPRPICPETSPVHIDSGTLVRQRSPNAGPVCLCHTLSHHHRPVAVDTLLFDEDQLLTFIESVAHAKVAERHIKVVWKDYDESAFINALYHLPFLGKPGIVEVDPGDIHVILAETKKESLGLQEHFCVAMSRGAERVTRWMEGQAEIRRSCMETVASAYREAAQLNEEMQTVAKHAVARLTVIKAASTITIKTAALFTGGWVPFLIGTGYDVSLDLIKNWEQAPGAKIIGVEHKVEDKLEKKLAKDAAKGMVNIYKKEEGGPAGKADWLRKRLAKMEEELKNQADDRKLRKFIKDGRRLQRAEEAASKAKWGARIFGSVKFGFFAWDIVKVAQDANQTFHQTGYDNAWSGIRDAFHPY